ncbi:zinc finger protein 14 [Drosophila grimshawi]|uniref:GH15154 n=1 Tax=Drosophila grimshawi TaxID=7222 RepID=B4IY63_DROGR|nr:zinc finger protein 14 [Drosophila grimshawi]EDV96513.1 GH15154 [Drosophila grimshawi]
MSTITPYSVNSICRVCLEYIESGIVHDLFLLPDLAKKFTVCTSLFLDARDGYPSKLCTSCYDRLDDLHDFQKLCVASAQRFKQMVANKLVTDVNPIDIFEPLPLASNEAELLSKDEPPSTDYDPLISHKLELIDNEEDVFKMLEHVDKEVKEVTETSKHFSAYSTFSSSTSSEWSLSDDDVPLAQRLLDQDSGSDSETTSKAKRKRKRIPASERHLHRIITCQICQQKFKKQLNYDEHMKHHNELLPFQCNVISCKKGFTTAAALRLHGDYAHTMSAAEIPCTVAGCKLLFPRMRLLTIHLKKVHNMSRVTVPRTEQPCTECGMQFRCPVALKKHMYKHTGEQLPYPCNICGKGFHINSALKNHLLRHAGIKNYVCPYCGVGKTTRQEWSKHILTHTQEKMFKCHICEHATHTKRALDNHVKIVHEKVRNYACQYCGKTFGKSHACKIHEMTHTGEKRCECKVCGKKFLYSESLTKHLKIHEKSVERAIETYRQRQVTISGSSLAAAEQLQSPADCQTVNADANAADQLLKVCAESVATIPRDPRRVERVDIAQLAGTVVNPIPAVLVPSNVPTPGNFVEKEGMHFCPGCNQGFNNLGNMKRHYKSVHEKVKDFECRFCARRFANSQSLKQHEWIHTGEKPYACKTCGTHFRQEAALIRHQKVHEEKPPKPVKPPKQITEKFRQKELQKCEKRRSVEALRLKIAEAAKEELQELAKQRVIEKQQNTYEQYKAAAAAAAEKTMNPSEDESERNSLSI